MWKSAKDELAEIQERLGEECAKKWNGVYNWLNGKKDKARFNIYRNSLSACSSDSGFNLYVYQLPEKKA